MKQLEEVSTDIGLTPLGPALGDGSLLLLRNGGQRAVLHADNIHMLDNGLLSSQIPTKKSSWILIPTPQLS